MHDNGNTRVDVYAGKGLEELLPDELYGMLSGRGLWVEEKGDDIVIRAYPSDVNLFVDSLKRLNITVKNIVVEHERPIDYKSLTQKYFRPIKIEDVTILAPWHKKPRNGRYIVIEPGMAFGTGRHESTRLMFRLMKTSEIKGKPVLDIGCGSGILSLYANLLGAKNIIAVDNDMDAVVSAKKNLELNSIQNVELVCSDAGSIAGRFDVILANLDIQTFSRYATHIMKLLSDEGIVVISGVLVKNRKNVINLFNPLSLECLEKKNSWCGLVFKKTVQSV